MTVDQVITLGQKMLEIALLVGMPVLLTTFLVGIIISIFQAATQIHEMTLTFIPKIVAALLALFIFGSWMLIKLIDYTKENFQFLINVVK
ncbi:flagellar biosynthetic protein FliQ [Desulfurobacterium thermolithotrophum DSM 11699]|uniref:Flagellar biosynthetic protein FliQ n=1 Tax=Desulfurobacterium thermolithotrophum (strain DSM 11699 / BSA) TaxID=868864 RepID=F0S0S4_DESTD|nr:flagellar biosynthesis protein FliQ [Desulfurobacterium thermolithotrophum]ADY73877.1 flagellar biosynthetic protein FliQ [Desulfurobacterium thermolithotrophum DSM 11699]